jgi:hypothetical protein
MNCKNPPTLLLLKRSRISNFLQLGTKLRICLNIPYLVIHHWKKAYTVLETQRAWSVNVVSGWDFLIELYREKSKSCDPAYVHIQIKVALIITLIWTKICITAKFY